MRNVAVFCLVACLTAIPAASAAEREPPTVPAGTDQAAKAHLDKLFDDLRRERREAVAERIATSIWEEWGHSGSATIDLMIQWADEAVKER